jgi:predicted permease
MTIRDATLRLRGLLARGRVERELDEELAFHIECETRKLVQNGADAAQARAQARARFGSVALAADQCRDQRGTNLIDDTARDVRYAFRSIGRAPVAALTIVGTIALGLGLIAVVFTFFNAFFFRVDAVRDPDQLFEVRWLPDAAARRVWIPFTRPDYEALRRDSGVFEDAIGILRGVSARVDARTTNGTLVTGNFFQVLGTGPSAGRVLTPADEQSGRLVIVLSSRGASKLFPNEGSVVGRKILLNGAPAEIVGTMPEGFRGLALGAPDYWAPLGAASQIRKGYAGKENDIRIDVVGRIKRGTSAQTATAGLGVWAAGQTDPKTGRSRPPYFRLRPSRGTVGDDAREPLMVFSPLFFAFGLILLIACANVANLLLARGVARQREIGVRLSLGASRRRVVRQLLTESLLLALIAAACSLAASRLMLDAAVRLLIATMPPEIAENMNVDVPPVDWRVLAFLLGGAIVSTAFFGLLPALQATRLELVRTMRGELVRDSRPGRARNVLIALQVTASALLLTCAAVLLRSALALATEDQGLRTSDTVMVAVDDEALRGTMIDALAVHPAVSAIAASSPTPLSSPHSQAFAEALATSTRIGVGYRLVSPEYFPLLDIPLLQGRGFAPSERAVEDGVVIVSQGVARRLWTARNPIGELVRLDDRVNGRGARPLPVRTFIVIGVVPDIKDSAQDVYLPTSAETSGTSFTLRVRGDPARVRLQLTEDLSRVNPALGSVMTMRTMAGLEVYLLRTAFGVTVILGVFALALTVSGLVSVLSYIVEQRRKEIGVRMAMGATARNVTRMVVAQSARPVVFGIVAGVALAAALAIVLRAGSVQIASSVRVFDATAYGSSIVAIAIACVLAAWIPASRAARIDPIATLRQD